MSEFTDVDGAIVRIDVNGTGIEVDDQGAGTGNGEAVLLVHGWPDTHALWDHQVAALARRGVPDDRARRARLRRFRQAGRSRALSIPFLFTDLSACSTISASNGCTSSATTGARRSRGCSAILAPDRVAHPTALSVGHPGAFSQAGMAQREKSWYMLLFQFVDIAEQWLMQDGWRNFRDWSHHPAADEVAAASRRTRPI